MSIEAFVSDRFQVGEAYKIFCGFAKSHYQLDEDTLIQYNRDKGIHNFMQDLADE